MLSAVLRIGTVVVGVADEAWGDRVVACVGGGSNAMGIFAGFVDDAAVELIGVEAAGDGLGS